MKYVAWYEKAGAPSYRQSFKSDRFKALQRAKRGCRFGYTVVRLTMKVNRREELVWTNGDGWQK